MLCDRRLKSPPRRSSSKPPSIRRSRRAARHSDYQSVPPPPAAEVLDTYIVHNYLSRRLLKLNFWISSLTLKQIVPLQSWSSGNHRPEPLITPRQPEKPFPCVGGVNYVDFSNRSRPNVSIAFADTSSFALQCAYHTHRRLTQTLPAPFNNAPAPRNSRKVVCRLTVWRMSPYDPQTASRPTRKKGYIPHHQLIGGLSFINCQYHFHRSSSSFQFSFRFDAHPALPPSPPLPGDG